VVAIAGALLLSTSAPAGAQEVIVVNPHAQARSFPHFWEQTFGSGRSVLTMRESYRDDLRATRQITGLQFVRFHGIFNDEMGVYNQDAQGNPVNNFS
jgi:xylan 1,4-beta-xylosidase